MNHRAINDNGGEYLSPSCEIIKVNIEISILSTEGEGSIEGMGKNKYDDSVWGY